jgi:hypothetical protein
MTCERCIDVADGVVRACSSESKRGYVCTRPIGHEGDHVACGIDPEDHPIEKWSQTVEEAKNNEQ